ncbi:hypothetical protein PQR71_12035 [Paraburkholderia fungorum]|uniref:hypothetical protein n=1 Tax=Paraburkholderia fungorum TaxID=134537 RepID=UPI0038BCD2DF
MAYKLERDCQTFYQPIGIEIVERAIVRRLLAFECSFDRLQDPGLLLIDATECDAHSVFHALYDAYPDSVHVMPSPEIAKAAGLPCDGKRITGLSNLLKPESTFNIVSGSEVFVHQTQGLGVVVFNKLLQSIPQNCRLRLVGDTVAPNLIDGPSAFTTLMRSGRFATRTAKGEVFVSELEMGARCQMAKLATYQLKLWPLPVEQRAPGRSHEEFVIETAATYREAAFKGSAVILCGTAEESSNWNIMFHNEEIELREFEGRAAPSVLLHNHMTATVGEPIVCVATHLERGLVAGMRGNLSWLPNSKTPSPFAGNQASAAVANFLGLGEISLSHNELTALDLCYACRPSLACLSHWDTVVVPAVSALTKSLLTQAQSVASRVVVVQRIGSAVNASFSQVPRATRLLPGLANKLSA